MPQPEASGLGLEGSVPVQQRGIQEAPLDMMTQGGNWLVLLLLFITGTQVKLRGDARGRGRRSMPSFHSPSLFVMDPFLIPMSCNVQLKEPAGAFKIYTSYFTHEQTPSCTVQYSKGIQYSKEKQHNVDLFQQALPGKGAHYGCLEALEGLGHVWLTGPGALLERRPVFAP